MGDILEMIFYLSIIKISRPGDFVTGKLLQNIQGYIRIFDHLDKSTGNVDLRTLS